LKNDPKPASADPFIVSLPEVYEIVGVSDMKENETAYLPVGADKVTAIIVAAGYEEKMMPLIEDKPKAMLDIKGKTLLERQVELLNENNIKDIAVVRGYQKDKINLPNIRYYDNDDYEKNYILSSLFCAEKEMHGKVVFSYSDIIYDKSILQKLLQSESDITLVVDRAWPDHADSLSAEQKEKAELVECKATPEKNYRYLGGSDQNVVKIGKSVDKSKAYGEFIGLAMFSEKGIETLKEVYDSVKGKLGEKASFHEMIQEIINAGHTVSITEVYKGWIEINTFDDYKKAWTVIQK